MKRPALRNNERFDEEKKEIIQTVKTILFEGPEDKYLTLDELQCTSVEDLECWIKRKDTDMVEDIHIRISVSRIWSKSNAMTY